MNRVMAVTLDFDPAEERPAEGPAAAGARAFRLKARWGGVVTRVPAAEAARAMNRLPRGAVKFRRHAGRVFAVEGRALVFSVEAPGGDLWAVMTGLWNVGFREVEVERLG